MGAVRVINGKRATRYRGIVRMKGYDVSRTFGTRTDAKRWIRQAEAAIDREYAEQTIADVFTVLSRPLKPPAESQQ